MTLKYSERVIIDSPRSMIKVIKVRLAQIGWRMLSRSKIGARMLLGTRFMMSSAFFSME